MHRRLKKLLHEATGESTFVVAIFLDVRGFSSWMTDSSQSALYLKSIYTKILDDYFPDADFFKPTGDGLLVIYRHDESNLTAKVNHAVATSIRLTDAFGTLTEGDSMVNFAVPERLGIGIARGSATRLASGHQTLDYSGHPLNLAARLMDLARPSGVVFDESLGSDLLEPGTAKRFSEESVYVKGIADELPIAVSTLNEHVTVPQFNRYPINRFEQHVSEIENVTLKELAIREVHLHELATQPMPGTEIVFYVRFPKVLASGRKHSQYKTTRRYQADFVERQGKPFARVDYRPIIAELTRAGVKAPWPGQLWLEFPIRPETPASG